MFECDCESPVLEFGADREANRYLIWLMNVRANSSSG
jgi:hypothetical protein